ncbi:MAG TPA: hypothetical protein VK453_13910 [Micromonosporaceae bacterium]|nr:hypothetical protein [Micromonosporaceae bacterium]
MGRKLLGYAVLAFIVFYVFSNPTGAAQSTRSLAAGLASAGDSVVAFLAALTP